MAKTPIDRIVKVLRDKQTIVTGVVFWRIPHNNIEKQDVRLKIGRYKKTPGFNYNEEPECLNPKSELTLDDVEFKALIEFIQENYEPFKSGIKAFIPLDKPFDSHTAQTLKGLFNHPEKRGLLDFIAQHDIIPEHLILAIHHKRRIEAIKNFESMLADDLTEQPWQKWFQNNSWVLGTEFVRVLDERAIDTQNISDFLMQAYDGFLDIVEIKRPEGKLKFWADKLDHGNCVPSSDLIKAITQATRYIYEVEREANSVKFLERVDQVKTIKPRCILIFGRSNDWDAEQSSSYRILNSSFHNLTILTYDHVLDRARRVLKHDEETNPDNLSTVDDTDDVPF
jgi:hypothetical protein